MTRFLVVPQWQGSPAARAMLLGEGAAAIAGDLPSAAMRLLETPLEAGDALGTGVLRTSSLLRVRELIGEAIAGRAVATATAEPAAEESPWLIVGGDCSVTVAALARLPAGTDDLALVWCDAHGDLQRPETSPSGAFAGMALRAAMGEGVDGLTLSPGIPPGRVVLVGARELDPAEQELLAEGAIGQLSCEALDDPDALAEAVAATGAKRVWLHLDLDVLDPAEIGGLLYAVPFGASVAALTTAIKRMRTRVPLAGATIAGFAPRSAEDAIADLGAILRLIGALA